MAVSGKKINELEATATITNDTLVPTVVVDSGVVSEEATKVSIGQISDHIKALVVPDQGGQQGKFLSTDGQEVSWQFVQNPLSYYSEDTTNLTVTIAPKEGTTIGTTNIESAVAEGLTTQATGVASHAEGIETKAGSQVSAWNEETSYEAGDYCLYENRVFVALRANINVIPAESGSLDWELAYNNGSQHAEGSFTVAEGVASHAEGYNSYAQGSQSHAEGNHTQAKGANSHAEGYYTEATADNAHSEGLGTIAASGSQHVQGRYNVADNNNTYADIIGNGTDSDNRSNIQTTTWTGNFWTKGTITDGSGNVLSNKIDKTTKATISTLGLVRPDGSTIQIDQYGTIYGRGGSGVEVLHFNGVTFTENYEIIKAAVTAEAPAMIIQTNGPRLNQVSYASNVAVFTGLTEEKEYTLTITLNDSTEVAAATLIIQELQKLFQFTTMPNASSYTGRICQYLGETTASYTKGYFYASIGGSWERISVQPEAASFASITGNPTDNTNLATALNAKQDNLTAGNNISIVNDTISATGVQGTLTAGLGINIAADNTISATNLITNTTDTDVVINNLAANTTYQLGVVDSITISAYTRSYEECTLYFTTGANGTTVTLPLDNSIIWAMSEPPTFEANKRCIICVANGLALTGGN